MPGIVDKHGRVTIVARVKNENPNADYVETLTLIVYLMEKALKRR